MRSTIEPYNSSALSYAQMQMQLEVDHEADLSEMEDVSGSDIDLDL